MKDSSASLFSTEDRQRRQQKSLPSLFIPFSFVTKTPVQEPQTNIPVLRLKGHLLWQGGKLLANYLETHATTLLSPSSTVLELGAGAGLPSLVCAKLGAQKVVVTDYPDPDLIENLEYNISANIPVEEGKERNISALGYLWGANPAPLLSHIPTTTSSEAQGFDLLLLPDLLFNHSQHRALLSSVQRTLKKSTSAQALVFFTPYRPWLYEKDMAFFELAASEEGGFEVEKIVEDVLEKVMFEEDPGVSI
jgi:EEF1A N-terminal glycine/lysine methyltransferase